MSHLKLVMRLVFLFVLLGVAPAFAQQSGPRNTGTLLKQLYGIDNAPQCNKNSFTVGTSAVKLLKNAAARASETVINPSVNTCLVWFDSSVSTTNGIVLGPSGGSVNIDFRSDLTLPTYEIWAVCFASNSNLTEVDCNVQ